MTDLELETLKQMRELCAEQMERAPTSCEYVDWRNKSWIIDGILDDEKERRELTTVHSEENETETENKTESEDIEMSTSEVNGVVYYSMNSKSFTPLKKMFAKLMKYKTNIIGASRFGVVTSGRDIAFFASDGNTAYYTEHLLYPDGNLKQDVWCCDQECFYELNLMMKSLNRYSKLEFGYADRQIIFRLNGKTATLDANEQNAEVFGKLFFTKKTERARVFIENFNKLDDVRKESGVDRLVITADPENNEFKMNGVKLNSNAFTVKWPFKFESSFGYVYSKKLTKVFNGKYVPGWLKIMQLDWLFVFEFERPGGSEMFISMLNVKDHEQLKKLYADEPTAEETKPEQESEPVTESESTEPTTEPEKEETETPTAKTDDVAKAIHDKVVEQCGKKWTDDHLIIMTPNMKPTKPEPEKEETEMTATDIKPAQETGSFTFSVSTSPTDFECIGLDYKPSIDLAKPTDKKTPEPVECKRPDLGEFIQGNKTYELYRNDELKRYRLTFKRHLTKDERDYLWTNKWTWRKEFKCYQWGFTKNGDEAARNAIEYFEKR